MLLHFLFVQVCFTWRISEKLQNEKEEEPVGMAPTQAPQNQTLGYQRVYIDRSPQISEGRNALEDPIVIDRDYDDDDDDDDVPDFSSYDSFFEDINQFETLQKVI